MLEKMVFKVGEKEVILTAEEARSMYADLKKLFEPATQPTYFPFQKYRDWDWFKPWQPPVYGPVTSDGGTNTLPKPGPGEVIWLKGDTEK